MSDNKNKQQPTVETTVTGPDGGRPSTVTSADASPSESDPVPETAADQIDDGKKGFFAYFKTKEFYITLILGQFLAITNTGTNTFNQMLADKQTEIPAFQTFFNYCLINIIFTSYTLYKYGIKGWFQMLWKNWWKYVILSFCDVEGNYFMVLAYQYTTMMSAQLINFWAIVIVVLASFIFLRVRYHISQIIGILICIGGMGVLIASDHIQGTNGGDISRGNQIKGDLFALLGATFYGLANTGEEYFVSTAPVYEVIGQMGFFGMIINGVQAGIFDRDSIKNAHWDGQVGGYLAGYTLCLSIFYSTAPLLFRLASAAFFNISLLTMNFWGVIIGIEVFKYSVHWMYPIAFVLIIIGQLIYYLGRKVLGEARKPWLGRNQERGFAGIFTAKRKIEANAAALRTSAA
ncbi:hypothetical protein ASPVEDRAFT_314870 [Aspergillus versicolor CBS 583.65]|uniref:EamA domain-containing protein n=1 Tax=Aspergillus versicolor CBS 583.65 TaxID=1036611 RepID=A0A1L9PXD7_ASPVE|nr:uncharacterized protein ASPVEDRAFT_314870 [Aspergillus versicolor CBS 583.65]OJJ06211.1 hypothetical protein ASPVEDRAFT_314870 [Aspergillus versicolor CBS 583.65]